VREERNGQIKVRHRGVEGWFAKADAVLLSDALQYWKLFFDGPTVAGTTAVLEDYWLASASSSRMPSGLPSPVHGSHPTFVW
jgi:hypothetical protein